MNLLKNRKILLLLIDIVSFVSISLAMIISSFESSTSVILETDEYLNVLAILGICVFLSRLLFRVYDNVWRYANSRAYLLMVMSDSFGGAIGTAICYTTGNYFGIWQTLATAAVFSLFTLVLRFGYQLRYRYYNVDIDKAHRIGVAIVGAGSTGVMLAEELLYSSNSRYRPICLDRKSVV